MVLVARAGGGAARAPHPPEQEESSEGDLSLSYPLFDDSIGSGVFTYRILGHAAAYAYKLWGSLCINHCHQRANRDHHVYARARF